MESFKNFLTVAFPQYLSKLPLPDDFQGFLTLSQEEWLLLLPLFVFVFTLSYLLSMSCTSSAKRANNWRDLSKPKIVDEITFKSDEEMLKVCRCWKSSTFPKCDGTHAEHCKSGADNAGPAVIYHEKK